MRFPHSATVQRLTDSGTKQVYAAQGTTPCFFQPLDLEAATQFAIVMSKAWAVYLPIDADVSEKDRLIYDGVTYSVRGMREHPYGSISMRHKKAIAEKLV